MIYEEIMRITKERKKKCRHLKVLDFNMEYWQNIRYLLSSAQIYEATDLFNFFSQHHSHEYPFRDNKYNILSVDKSIWLEAKSVEGAHSYATLLEWMPEKHNDLLKKSEKYRLGTECRCGCKIRFFIQLLHEEVLPLNWEWLEFIDRQSAAAGGILEPLEGFIYGKKLEDMQNYLSISHQLGFLLADFSLFSLTMLNTQKVSFSKGKTVFGRENPAIKLLIT